MGGAGGLLEKVRSRQVPILFLQEQIPFLFLKEQIIDINNNKDIIITDPWDESYTAITGMTIGIISILIVGEIANDPFSS